LAQAILAQGIPSMYQAVPTFRATGPQHGQQDARGAEGSEARPLLSDADVKPPGGAETEANAAWRLAASSAGFLADAYDLFTIDLVILILGFEYGAEVSDAHNKSLMVSTMLAGIIVGQLSFGFVADWLGRKWAFVATAGLTVVGAVLSALVRDGGAMPLPLQLALCRLVLGVGVGGEYPLSATVTAESSEQPHTRGLMLAFVISMQGWGMLLSSLVAMIGLSLQMSLEALWRMLLGVGALPSLVAFFLRWRMHESNTFSKAKEAHSGEAAGRGPGALTGFWARLLGTAGSWFLMNFSLYSLGSFKSQVVHDFVGSDGLSDRRQVFQAAGFAALTSCFAIVGFVAALLLINRMGRYLMQLSGFAMLSVIFFILAIVTGTSVQLPTWIFIVLLGLIFFFMNLGPNTTTFVVPAEAFPTLVRATCHGVSAASGKIGAFVGTMCFPHAEAALGMHAVYLACGATAVVGAVLTFFLTPRTAGSLTSLDEGRSD